MRPALQPTYHGDPIWRNSDARAASEHKSPQPRSLFPGNRILRSETDGQKWRCRSNVLRQRPKCHCGELVGLEPHSLPVGLSVRFRPATTHSGATGDSPFVEMPINCALFELECLVSDKVSWSDRPVFHNTLVVGSSPTSSTTQSPATGESGHVQNASILHRCARHNRLITGWLRSWANLGWVPGAYRRRLFLQLGLFCTSGACRLGFSSRYAPYAASGEL